MRKLGQISLPQDHPTDYARRLAVMLYQYLRDLVVQINALIDASVNTLSVTVDFGSSFTDKASTVVTGQPWVTATSKISGSVMAPTGVDPDEMRLLDMRVVISDLVAGTGFTVTVYTETEAKGTYTVACSGV